jgi:hypothetical protein
VPRSRVPFVWPVACSGYRWVSVERDVAHAHLEAARAAVFGAPRLPTATDSRCLVEVDPRAGNRLSEPCEAGIALHRALAQLQPTEARIVSFAKRWGFLGFEWLSGGTTDPPSPPLRETRLGWQHAVDTLAAAVRLHDAITDADVARMRSTITQVDPDYETRDWRDNPDPSPTETGRRARIALSAQINARLALYARAGVFPQDAPEDGYALGWQPLCLLGAAWIELAEALGGVRQFRRCARDGCPRWFKVEPHRTRTDRAYCGPTCRVHIYHQRKAGEPSPVVESLVVARH